MTKTIDTEKVTRLEVIDELGRQYVNRDCKIEISMQDGGLTMKVFIINKKRKA